MLIKQLPKYLHIEVLLTKTQLKERGKIELVVEERIVEIETTIDNRKQFTENKEELAEQVTDTFGFQYVP